MWYLLNPSRRSFLNGKVRRLFESPLSLHEGLLELILDPRIMEGSVKKSQEVGASGVGSFSVGTAVSIESGL